MKNNAKSLILSSFEKISEDENILSAGFSTVQMLITSNNNLDNTDDQANNCLGGNCTMYCGYDQNLHCNTFAGCSS